MVSGAVGVTMIQKSNDKSGDTFLEALIFYDDMDAQKQN